MATPSNQQHARPGLRPRSSSRAPKPAGRRRPSPSHHDPNPDPFDFYSFAILLNLINLIGSIPMFVALLFIKIETGLKDVTSLVFCYTVYNVSLLASPLLGILASAFRLRWLARAHAVCFMSVLIIPATIGFLLFFNAITVGEQGRIPTAIRNVTEYSSWLREEVEDPKLWSRVKRDLVEEIKVCDDFEPSEGDRPEELHLLFAGCCVNSCEKGEVVSSYNASCLTWSEDPGTLCYDCESCRSAVLGEINFRLALCVPMFVVTLVFHFVTTVALLLVCFLGLKEEE